MDMAPIAKSFFKIYIIVRFENMFLNIFKKIFINFYIILLK